MKQSNSMKAYELGRRAIESGDFGTARSAFRWAVGLDPDNPIFTYAAANAAFRARREDEAETLFRRAMEDTVKTLGPTHPHLATVAHGMVQLYEKQGRDEEVRRLCREVVGNLDPRVAATANGRVLRRFADLFQRAGRPREAVLLYRHALAYRRGRYGDSHPQVAECMGSLAEFYHRTGGYEKARRLLKTAMDMHDGKAMVRARSGAADHANPGGPGGP